MARLNVQEYLIGYLHASIPDACVRTRIPEPRPKRLVVVQRTGGGRANSLQDRPGVHLLVYGGTEWETSELAGRVGDAMDALNRSNAAFMAGIDHVREESLRSDPDTQTQPDTPRWFGSYTLTTHAY